MNNLIKKLEVVFELFLWESRLIILLAVVASIFSAFVLAMVGTLEVVHVGSVFFTLNFLHPDEAALGEFHKDAITNIISAVDAYLITTVLLIFGIGLYELFISKIDRAERDERSSKILIIHSLDQLKEKLAKVIIMVLLVTFFQHALKLTYDSIESLLLLAGGVMLLALAMFLMAKASHHEEEEEKTTDDTHGK